MIMQQELLFDLVESEASLNVFFDRDKEGFKAKGAAIIITGSPIGHFPKKRGDRFTVWFGRGIERWTFKNFKEASLKVTEMLQKASKAKVEVNFRFEGKEVKKFNKILAKTIVNGNEQEKQKEA